MKKNIFLTLILGLFIILATTGFKPSVFKDQKCPVDLTYTSSIGCKIHIIGQSDCGTGNNFTGTVTFSGPSANGCVNGTFGFRFGAPNDNEIEITLSGGSTICGAGSISFSDNGSCSACSSLLNSFAAEILSDMKRGLGC